MAHRSGRAIALAALRQWRAGNDFADAILAHFLRSSDLGAADKAFATELFYGVLRNLTLLDFWIGILRRNYLDLEARDLLRLGIYQLLLLKTPEHAAVYETVALANARNRSLINAVLRSAVRQLIELETKANEESLEVRTSHPRFLIERWTANFGVENTIALCQWNNRPPPTFARINHLKISDQDFLSKYPEAERLRERPNFVRPTILPSDALEAGDCYIQDPSTALASLLLAPQAGDSVLDACAAPGGKTGYLAELMENRGRILACDRDANRLRTTEENLGRLGVSIAQFFQHDWRNETQLLEFSALVPFDKILVDAPCSNTGVMRRRVDIRWRLTPKDFARMHEKQLHILRATIPFLKPGGILVYSTCSIEPEENEEVVRAVLQKHPFLKLADQLTSLPFSDGFDGAFAAKLIRAS